ncbi:hypothetical protein Taro_033372 [Colocasia esculenta]|uniref:Uncharacterized protein n=1 Tax=Colocasia esculenta TaxID=4460 RepID=A0A843WCA8_COLES|nr:hypothetical protein [Colocasia esculenta]
MGNPALGHMSTRQLRPWKHPRHTKSCRALLTRCDTIATGRATATSGSRRGNASRQPGLRVATTACRDGLSGCDTTLIATATCAVIRSHLNRATPPLMS